MTDLKIMKEIPNNSLFITGTDTSVGKTYFCARFLEFLKNRNIRAGYQKWVATGAEAGLPEDLSLCLEAAGLSTNPELMVQQVPYCFSFAASPHLAAEMENRDVDAATILQVYRRLAARYELLVVEGVGGIMVPLRRDLLLADLLAQLQIRTLVVARSGLGTLNHTLLTLEALRTRKIPVMGVVFSDTEKEEDERLVQDNMRTVAEIGLIRVFGRLKRLQNAEEAKISFKPTGQAILEQFRET
jgi:dethiobiotin synthetase